MNNAPCRAAFVFFGRITPPQTDGDKFLISQTLRQSAAMSIGREGDREARIVDGGHVMGYGYVMIMSTDATFY